MLPGDRVRFSCVKHGDVRAIASTWCYRCLAEDGHYVKIIVVRYTKPGMSS